MPLHPRVQKAIRMKSVIADSWKGLLAKIENASGQLPPIQRKEMYKTFVCGYYACFDLLFQISISCSEEEANIALTRIKEEAEKAIKNMDNLTFNSLPDGL